MWDDDRGSPDGSSERLPVNTKDSIVPVTIKQIREALEQMEVGQHDVIIDREVRKNISIVGFVKSASAQDICYDYVIDDGTSDILVHDYRFDADGDSGPPFTEHAYVYIVGKLMNGEQSVSAFSVQRVDDCNQIPFHMLQALFVHMLSTRAMPADCAYAAIEKRGRSKAPDAAPPDPARRAPAEQPREGLVDAAILAFLRRGNRSSGTPRNMIVTNLLGQFSIEEIEEGIERLRYNLEIYPGEGDSWVPVT
jgi:hypothetical protein